MSASRREVTFGLGAKFGSMTFVRTFASAGRSGLYLRVEREGMVGAGDAIVRLSTDQERPTAAEEFGSFACKLLRETPCRAGNAGRSS